MSYYDDKKKARSKKDKKRYDSDAWYDESNTFYKRYTKVQESRAKKLAEQTAETLSGAGKTAGVMNILERTSRGDNGIYTDPVGRYITDRMLGAMRQNVREAGSKAVSDIDNSYAKRSDKDYIRGQADSIINSNKNTTQGIMDSRRQSNSFMNQFDSKKAYDNAFNTARYMSKYGGKTYEELKKINQDNESRRASGQSVDETEDEWIKSYARTVKTGTDIDREIEENKKKRIQIEQKLESYYSQVRDNSPYRQHSVPDGEIINNTREDRERLEELDREREQLDREKREYDDAVTKAGYMSKYGGKTYEELKKIIGDNESNKLSDKSVDEAEEKWIKDYADSIKSVADVDKERQAIEEKINAPEYRMRYRNMSSRDLPEIDYEKRLKELDSERERILARDYYAGIPYNDDFNNVSLKGIYRGDNKVTYAEPVFNTSVSLDPAADRINDKLGLKDGNYMSPDEKRIYSYILEKEGRDRAEEYRTYLADDINYRKAAVKYGSMKGHTAMELASSVASGLNRFTSGFESAVNNLFGDEALPVSEGEYLSGMVREDLENFGPKIGGHSLGQAIYDIGENAANMAPTFIPGISGLGSAAMLGLNAGASSANAAWRDGADRADALKYGAVNGTLEGGLQYLLGGISVFGGKATGITKDLLTRKINNSLGKAVVKTGISMLGEGTEEYLQEIIDPVVRNLTLGENNKFEFITDEALYSGMLGAISGGLFESGSNITQARIETAYQKIGQDLDAGKIDSLVNYAEKTDALKDAVENYKSDPSDINAGMLKVLTDRHIGEQINEFIKFEDAETDLTEMDGYVADIAKEALDEAETIVSQSQSDEGLLSKAIDSFSESALNVMNKTLDYAVVDPVTYKNAFANYYQYGRAGMSFDTAESNATYRDELTDAQKKLAYETGKNDRNVYFDSAQKGVPGRTNSATGVLRYINESETAEGIAVPAKIKDLDSRQKSSVAALRAFAEISGQNIALYSSEAVNGKVTAPNGWYDKSSDTIYIDVNSGDVGENAMLRTASHEITHTFKEWSPEKYKALQDYVIGQFEADGSIDMMVQEEIRLAKSNGRSMTYTEAMDEVTANACETMLRDTTVMERMANESPDIFSKIKSVIAKIVEDIKHAFEGLRSGSIEHKRMSEILEDWSGIQKLWDDAAVESAVNARAAQEGTGNSHDNLQYSIRSEFFNEYDKWDRINPRVKFNLGKTSNALKEIGIEESDIIFDSSKIIKIKKKHPEMTDSIIKKIPELLEHPIVIMESKTVPGRIVLYGDVSSTKGPVMAALELHPSSKGVQIDNIIKVASAYTKDNAQNQIKNSNILWVYDNKKKTSDWLRRTGLQLPVGINQYGLIKSISSQVQQVNYREQKSQNINLNPGLQLTDIANNSDFNNKVSRVSEDVNRDFTYVGDSDISYSLRKSFAEQVDDVLGNKGDYEYTHVLVRNDTPKVLTDTLGLPDLPMLMTAKHVYTTSVSESQASLDGKYSSSKKVNYHDLGDVLKDIPSAIENPVMIIKSNTDVNDSRIVLFTDLKDKSGNPVVIAVGVNGKGRLENQYIDTNIILSVYGKDNHNFISKAVQEDRILYYDKEKSQDINLNPGLQLTDITNIRGFNDNLAHYRQIVNNIVCQNTQKNTFKNKDNDFSYRGDTRSNREILADALMSATKNASERRSLESYQRVIGALDMQERLRREKVRLRNNAETAAERDGYQKDIDAIDKKIAYNDKRLIQMEAAAPIREIIKREVKANTEHDIDYIKKRDEQRRRKKQMTVLRNNIKNNSASLISMLKRPTNQRHVPEGLKEPVTRFLASIDFISQQADPGSFNTMVWQDNMNRLAVMLNNTNNLSDDNGAYNIEFDPALIERMSEFAKENNGKKLTSLDMKQVEELYIIVRSLRMGISNANKMFANNRSADAQKLGYNTMQELSGKSRAKDRVAFVSELAKLLNTDMLDSSSYFKMLGENAGSVYKELYDGWKVSRNDIKEAGDYVQDVYKSMDVKQKEINEWTGTGAKIHKFDIRGTQLELTTAQVMSLYEHGKREQSRNHIFGHGIIADVINRRFKSKNKSDNVRLSEAELNRITSVLTERQKQFADSLQSYIGSQCAQKGNETSMAMYGYRKFNEKNYFPIKVDGNSTQSGGKPSDINIGVRSIINQGMTKNIEPKAENPIIIRDIFDAFTDHVVEMANYHGLAAPITDALKWYNYKYSTGDGYSSVQEQIERVYGKEYKDYFINLLLDINSDTARKIASNIPEKFVSAYKASAVGANLRVVVQQPTAYIRAAALIEPKYLIKALPQKSAYKEAIDNSVLAWWKSQGYYDTGLGQSLKSLVTGQQTFRDNVVEKSMWLAGKADELTWGKLWNAVKLEVADNNKSLDTSSEAYMKKVTERFEQIIDETQVVDTVFSKSQIMRSQNGLTKNLTAFMAEPIKSYNMLRNAALTKNPKKIAGAVSIFLVNSVATSAVSAVMDAMRALSGDEDKEKEFLERYEENFIKNFADNSNPLNLIPYIREIQSVFEFTSFNSSASNRPEIAWISTLAKSCSAVVKCFDGSSNKPPMYVVKQCAKAASQISGIPAYNFTRELEAVYNTVKYDVFGKKPYDEVVREAAEARLGGDMDTYSSLVYELKDEGYELDDIIKKVNGNMIQIKKEQKEIEKQADSEEQAADKEEKEQSMYNMSDVDTLLSSNDVLGVNRVLNNLFNTELANADRGVKDYKYETYKKLRQKIRARLSKNYKKIESASEREKYGELLRQLTIEKLYIYNEKDIRSLEKAIAREAKEKQKNNL